MVSEEVSGTNKIQVLSGNALKCIAMTTMIIDHIGYRLLPELTWMRIVGRIAFPVYAFLIVEGFYHTHDRKRYIATMVVAAVLSEVPFDLFLSNRVLDMSHQNVLWTFELGLICMYASESSIKVWQKFSIVFVSLFLSELSGIDYGLRGMLTLMAFYIIKKNGSQSKNSVFAAIMIFAIAHVMLPSYTSTVFGQAVPLQMFAVLALPIIMLYNGKRGSKSAVLKYGFYVFYPLHMVCIWLIRNVII